MDKQNVAYYRAIKMKEVLKYAITLMNLENIMPSKKSQLQKTIYCIILLI